MDLGTSLRKNARDEITVLSIIALSVQEVYKNITGNTVSVKSVQIKGKKIFIKTDNKLINSELSLLVGNIHEILDMKITKLGFPSLKNMTLSFI
ncbi:hypothetical protein GW846_05835 [Candidatus Gracilibacteria bacterium]|nr:hypothetical protein [Candidatus Gracilibacteria bacterium]